MKMCPQCRRGFEDNHEDCTDCGCELLTEHGLDQSYPWTRATVFNDEVVAKAAALHLSEHDIPAVIRPTFNSPFVTIVQTVELWVPEHMAQEAKALLSNPGEFEIDDSLLTSTENDD
jgi:hypothetical protein